MSPPWRKAGDVSLRARQQGEMLLASRWHFSNMRRKSAELASLSIFSSLHRSLAATCFRPFQNLGPDRSPSQNAKPQQFNLPLILLLQRSLQIWKHPKENQLTNQIFTILHEIPTQSLLSGLFHQIVGLVTWSRPAPSRRPPRRACYFLRHCSVVCFWNRNCPWDSAVLLPQQGP